MCRHLGCFDDFCNKNNATQNNLGYMYFYAFGDVDSGYIPRNESTGSVRQSVCIFVGCSQIPLMKGCIGMHGHKQ